MTMLPHKNFTGEFPRLNAYDLQPGAAQSATNVDFTQGNLQGIKTRSAVPGVNAPGAKSLFIYDSLVFSYYSWARDVDAVRSPIADDAYSRFYWSDGSNFYVSRGDLGGSGGEPSSTNRYWVGVPQPAGALTVPVADNKFNVYGQRPYLYVAFCEGSDGSRKGEIPLTGTYTTDTLAAATITSPLSLACSTFNVAATTTTVTPTTTDENGVIVENSSSGVTTNTQPAITYSMAVEVRIPVVTGGHISVILRENTNKNTYPGEASGMSGSFSYTNGTLTVYLRARTDYVEARAYTYTYVNQYGEEGPPANPLQVEMFEGQAIILGYTPPPSGNYAPINRIRLYRTATGGTGTEYLFVKEVVVNTTAPTVRDGKRGANLGESLQTRDFYPPPQNLRGICVMPGGVMAGFSGNTVWFSQPYLPYAWKPSTTQALERRVVGMVPYENGLYVTTVAHPVLITGYTPDTMSSQKIPAIQAGVSKGSIVNAGPFAVYASNDGLVTLRGVSASLDMSFKFFTREQWRNLYGSKLPQMRLDVHDGHLLAWFEDGTPGFLIRLDEVTPSFTNVTDPVYCALVNPLSDALYVGAGSTIYTFKGGSTRQSWTHWGKDYILPKQENLGAIQLVGGGDVTVTVYGDGTQVFQTLVTMNDQGSTVFRLPSGFRARRWSFKLDGAANSYIYEMNIVTSPAELQGV